MKSVNDRFFLVDERNKKLTIVEIKFVEIESLDQISESLGFEGRQMGVAEAPGFRLERRER